VLAKVTAGCRDKLIAFRVDFGLCFGMNKGSKIFTDENGDRYYNAAQAAVIVGGICDATMHKWVREGVTSFGLKLDLKSVSVSHRPNGYRVKNESKRRDLSYLIPEAQVMIMKEAMQVTGNLSPGGLYSLDERDRVGDVAVRIQRRRNTELKGHNL
jgi:hypothetical protein